jgi:HlyD family secretion protein
MRKHFFILFFSILFLSCSSKKSSELIQANGTVEAREVIVSSEVTGKIIQINFDEGSKVDSGFVLCQVDTELIYQRYLEVKSQAEALYAQYQLLLKGARAEEIEAMEEIVNRARANFENAQRQFERIKSLYEDGVVTQEQFDNAKTLFESSRAQYEEAKRKLEVLKKGAREEEIKSAFANYNRALAQMRTIKIQLEKSKITSPISGFVVGKFVELGEFVSSGTPIAKIANLDEVYIRIYVPEKELGLVKLNDTVNVKIDSHPDKVFKGSVVFISPKAEFTPKNVQTKDERVKLVYAVKVKVKNEDGIFKPGMPADVEIIKRR